MAMPQRMFKWTLAELHRLPEDGNRYEVVRGDLFVTPAPSPDHEELGMVLDSLVSPYVRAHALGNVYRPRAVIQLLKSEVEPDLMVRPPRTGRSNSWAAQPLPILVVEVMSDATQRRNNLQKRALYDDAGIPEYWIVDAEHRTMRVVRPEQEDLVAAESFSWHPAGASEPLVVDVAALFSRALGQPGDD